MAKLTSSKVVFKLSNADKKPLELAREKVADGCDKQISIIEDRAPKTKTGRAVARWYGRKDGKLIVTLKYGTMQLGNKLKGTGLVVTPDKGETETEALVSAYTQLKEAVLKGEWDDRIGPALIEMQKKGKKMAGKAA